jgi:hypothetical protein
MQRRTTRSSQLVEKDDATLARTTIVAPRAAARAREKRAIGPAAANVVSASASFSLVAERAVV